MRHCATCSKNASSKYCNMICFRNRGFGSSKKRDSARVGISKLLAKVPIHCCQCGDKFIRSRIDERTCSNDCSEKLRKSNQLICLKAERAFKLKKQVRCEGCPNWFYRKDSRDKYCSQKCRMLMKTSLQRARRKISSLGKTNDRNSIDE